MGDMAPDLLALQRLYFWERTAPTRLAMTQPMGGGVTQDTTWGALAAQVRGMAAYLQSQGWEPGSRVAILSKNCSWWMMSDLAIWMAGYVSVPLYPTLAPDTVNQILTHSEAKACFIGKLDGWSHMKPGVPAGMHCIAYPLSPDDVVRQCKGWDAICSATPGLQGNPTRAADELATLIYTSGTTGKPKGVMHSFGNFAWALDAGIKRLTMGPDDRMLSYLPLAHVVERVLVEHGWLRTGLHVYFAESLDTFAADMQRCRPTIFFSVPRLWVKFQHGVHAKMPAKKLGLLLDLPLIGGLVRRKILKGLGLDQCRIAAGGAAPMPADVLQWYRKLGLDLIEVYGMTENCGVSHSTLPGSRVVGTVGLTYDEVESRIDPATGEIQMRSAALMQGYYKDPAATAEAMTADGWLRTGDKGQIDAQGFLRITGRVKDIFKTSKGKYVAPAPIEDQLVQHPDIEACAVTGANLTQPLGLVMLSQDAINRIQSAPERQALTQSLAAHLDAINARLEPHEKLGCLAVIAQTWTPENGFVTPTFKVKRMRIEEAYAGHFDNWLSQRQPVVWSEA